MVRGQQNVVVKKLGGATDLTMTKIDLANKPQLDLTNTAGNLLTLGSFFGVEEFFGPSETDEEEAPEAEDTHNEEAPQPAEPQTPHQTPAQAEHRAALKAKLEQQVSALPGALTDYALDMVIEKLDEMLEGIEVVGDVLAFAWSRTVELAQYYREIQANPGESFAIPLVNHEVVSEHPLSMKVKLKHQLIGNLECTVSFGVVVDGVLLQVENGKITSVKIGAATGSGSINILDQPLMEVPETSLELPTLMSWEDGVALFGITPTDTEDAEEGEED